MDYPPVSMLVAIRNEAAYIERSLKAILQQDYAGKIEILIADGMSSDNTRAIVNNLAAQYPHILVKILDNHERIASTGLNMALRQACGEVLVRVDGHTIIAKNYVHNCVEHLLAGADGVGGSVVTVGETPLAKNIALAMSSPFGVGNSAMRILQNQNLFTDTVPFPAYTRKIIQQIGLYDEELIRDQDDEYNYRLRKAGGILLLAANVKSEWYNRSTLSGLWRQYYQYGYYKVRVLQKHPLQMSLRQFVPPAFVFSLLISFGLAFSPTLRHSSIIVPLSYLLANLGASVWVASRDSWSSFIFLPLIFAILHLSYGLGFLIGLLKFANRWGDKLGKTPSFTSKNA